MRNAPATYANPTQAERGLARNDFQSQCNKNPSYPKSDPNLCGFSTCLKSEMSVFFPNLSSVIFTCYVVLYTKPQNLGFCLTSNCCIFPGTLRTPLIRHPASAVTFLLIHIPSNPQDRFRYHFSALNLLRLHKSTSFPPASNFLACTVHYHTQLPKCARSQGNSMRSANKFVCWTNTSGVHHLLAGNAQNSSP